MVMVIYSVKKGSLISTKEAYIGVYIMLRNEISELQKLGRLSDSILDTYEYFAIHEKNIYAIDNLTFEEAEVLVMLFPNEHVTILMQV